MSESVHYTILERVQDDIRKLELPQLPESQVYLRWALVDRQTTLPAVVIAPHGQEAEEGGTNVRDDIGYPVGVAIVADGNQDLTANLELYLGWRQRIYRYFRNDRRQGADNVFYCRVTPMSIVDPTFFLQHNLLVSGLLLRFVNREDRG